MAGTLVDGMGRERRILTIKIDTAGRRRDEEKMVFEEFFLGSLVWKLGNDGIYKVYQSAFAYLCEANERMAKIWSFAGDIACSNRRNPIWGDAGHFGVFSGFLETLG